MEGLSKLNMLNISGNHIGDAGAKVIAAGLPKINTLFIKDNNLSNDAKLIVRNGHPNAIVSVV